MFNLLRMDLYRLFRSKSVYICLGILLGMTALCYWMVWMASTPDGMAFAEKIGMTLLSDSAEENSLQLEGSTYNTLSMYREISMDGGAYSCILGIVTALFVCSDFNSGFIKNIMSLHRNRWKYMGSKLLAAGILNFFYMALSFLFSLLMNLLFQNLVPAAGIAELLFYMSWAWLITAAFTALLILISVLTRNTAAAVVSALLLGSGLLVSILSSVTGMFNMNGWLPYTLYYNITYGSSVYSGIHDLRIYAVGAIFLALYSVAAAVTLSRRDI